MIEQIGPIISQYRLSLAPLVTPEISNKLKRFYTLINQKGNCQKVAEVVQMNTNRLAYEQTIAEGQNTKHLFKCYCSFKSSWSTTAMTLASETQQKAIKPTCFDFFRRLYVKLAKFEEPEKRSDPSHHRTVLK